jgi:glycerophosphoryl diester phosphodiesterase
MIYIAVVEPCAIRLLDNPSSKLQTCITTVDGEDMKNSVDEPFWNLRFQNEICMHFSFDVITDSMPHGAMLKNSICGMASIRSESLTDLPINEYTLPIIDIHDARKILGLVRFRCSFVGKRYPELKFDYGSWKDKQHIFIGHRGSGANKYGQKIPENTIASFNNAMLTQAVSGVELDVMLTRDKQLVVYHDLEYPVSIRPEKARTYSNVSSPVALIRYEEMCQGDHEFDPPLLSHVLKELNPSHAGIVIEIKYPSNSFIKEHGEFGIYTRSTLVDAVLDCLNKNRQYIQNRWIIFSSFDPDICMHLRCVLFDSCMVVHNLWLGHEEDCTVDFSDIRNREWSAAVKMASDGMGIAIEAEYALNCRREDLQGLVIFSYGENNLNVQNIEYQKLIGVFGFFIDNMELANK